MNHNTSLPFLVSKVSEKMNTVLRMKSRYAHNFFSVNEFILRCAGLWRPRIKNKYAQILYKAYAIFVFVFVNLWFTSTELVSIFYTYKNEDELIKNVNFFLTHFMGAIKVVFWYFSGDKLISIMHQLEDPKLQYESCVNFDPGEISHEYKRQGIKYTILFLLLAHATLTSSYVPPILTTLQFMYHRDEPNSTVTLPTQLPYFCWMPFSYNTAIFYLLALAYQAGPMFSYAYSVVGMDSLFMSIMNCVAGNVTIVQGAFLTIRERCIKQPLDIPAGQLYESDILMVLMRNEMKKIINHLQVLFQVCERLEKVHRYVTFCQVTATLFILCTCLYLVSTAPPFSKQFIAELVYMTAMFFQLFLYCSFGNEITLKFQDLSTYVWSSDWLQTDTQFKKYMIFTIMRASKPVLITAGKFTPLTLSTFMSVIKTSYSIFALIKNTKDN